MIGAWPVGLTSQSLADFAAEILRLTEAAGPAHVAIGTDLDGNYRPVLTSYSQLADLTGLLRDRGLPADDIQQVLGGNAAGLLRRIIPWTARYPAASVSGADSPSGSTVRFRVVQEMDLRQPGSQRRGREGVRARTSLAAR